MVDFTGITTHENVPTGDNREDPIIYATLEITRASGRKTRYEVGQGAEIVFSEEQKDGWSFTYMDTECQYPIFAKWYTLRAPTLAILKKE